MGYDISGTSLIVCEADGTWSARPITCTKRGIKVGVLLGKFELLAIGFSH